ncbi:MAG TPA: MmgE/PrpD family protein [Solirubrobacteraceae bacterium]|nr:MmgE/PrpD family protein [Solirubrobacteraceae bacterium]
MTRLLASWLADSTLEEVPAPVRVRAKHVLLDGIGCALVGARLPWSDAATDALCRLEGNGRCVLIGTGRTTSPSAAALLNSSYVQGFELDDYHPVAPVHGASLVLPAILAAAADAERVTGATVLLAAIRGFEVGPRVGLALHGAEMLTRGWHSGPVFGGPAAAAAAGTVYGLDAGGFEDALGIAATQAGGLMAAQFGSMCKRMQHGFAARNGLLGATLAAGSYTGIKQVFERPYGGFLATFGEGHAPDPSQISAGLGERWETETIAIKPYAAMAGLHAAIDAARQLLAAGDAHAADVASIEISVSEPAFHHGGWRAERPLAAVGAQMNLAYAVAVTLLDGTALAAQFAPARIEADDVWELIGRTTVRHEPRFDERPEDGYNTRVALSLHGGGVREALVEHPRGGLLAPLSNEEVLEKFRALTEPLIDARRAAAIEQAVPALEDLADLDELAGLLAGPVTPLFGEDGRA